MLASWIFYLSLFFGSGVSKTFLTRLNKNLEIQQSPRWKKFNSQWNTPILCAWFGWIFQNTHRMSCFVQRLAPFDLHIRKQEKRKHLCVTENFCPGLYLLHYLHNFKTVRHDLRLPSNAGPNFTFGPSCSKGD